MDVYLVIDNDYESAETWGVYSTKALADQVAQNLGFGFVVVKIAMDDMNPTHPPEW